MVTKKRASKSRDRDHEKLVEEITRKVKRELILPKEVVPVRVKFKPEDWKVYTYLAPKDHGLSEGDKVQTPTGPAIVERLEDVDYNPVIAYKSLKGRYAYIPFEYE
jgi:hypothetical protein